MADNTVLPGTGETYASDEISSVNYQRVKLSIGAAGAAVDCSSAAPMPIQAEGNSRDDLTNSLIVLDQDIHAALNQEAFRVSIVDTAMEKNAWIGIVLITPAAPKRIYMAVDWASRDPAHLEILEVPTTVSGGAALTEINRYRDSSVESALTNFTEFTSTDGDTLAGGTVIESEYTWAGQNLLGGQRQRLWVLKASTQYGVKLTVDEGTNAGQIVLNWVEHTDSN